MYILEINKNLKGSGDCDRKYVASYQAKKLLATHWLYRQHWLLYVSVHTNTIPAG